MMKTVQRSLTDTMRARRIEVWELIVKYPGSTCAELEHYAKKIRHYYQPRISELKKEGIIQSRGPRICTVTNNTAYSYYTVKGKSPHE